MTSFGKLAEGDFFVCSEGVGLENTLFRKHGSTAIPYDRFAGVRHGALQFYPDADRHKEFPSNQTVIRLNITDESD